MIINGYFRPLISEQTWIGYLYSIGIPLRDFTEYFKNVTDRLTKQIEGSAEELGPPVVYLPSAMDRKENIAKDLLLSSPVDKGLICVLKTLESCRSARVISTQGKQFLKSSSTKCLYYYLYYLDKEFYFIFVKIQTWFPFNIQVYINGREWLKHVFDENGITYKCYDNSFTDISDLAKAQELADKFDSKRLRSRLDAFARSLKPFLDIVQKTFGQGYLWCVDQCAFATGIMCIMEAVSDGRYLINGFWNKDIAEAIFPQIRDAKKRSSRTSRILKKLCQHGLVKNVPRSRRYHVTSKGRRIMGTLIELYHKDYPEHMSKAA